MARNRPGPDPDRARRASGSIPMVLTPRGWDHGTIANRTRPPEPARPAPPARPARRPLPGDPGPDLGRTSPPWSAGLDGRPWIDSEPDHRQDPGRARRRGRRRSCRGGLFRRASEGQILGGIAGGLSARLGVDVTVVRVALVLFGLFSGFGAAAYVLAWLLLPVEGQTTTIASRAVSDARGLVLAVAFVPALVAALLIANALHASFVNSFAWTAFLSGAGLVLVWRNAGDDERARLRQVLEPFAQLGWAKDRSRAFLAVRIGLGIALLVGGVVAVAHRHTFWPVSGALLIAASFVVVFGPWWLGLARDLVSERQARLLAEQRAEMAARVHDSVLQTLALVQRSADDPHRVVALARAQERELRSWLFEGRVPGSLGQEVTTLAGGVGLLEREVEATHGVAVDAVTVGDCPLDDRLRALLEAGREAMVNAARWSGAPAVSLFAEVEPNLVSLFIRDRGRGFDPGAVGPDHRGISESIEGRMERHGGRAEVRSAPGEGTEVRLSMPVERRR
ncbi:MAG: ATP-binding protein [Acidimicrobiales bacterium]